MKDLKQFEKKNWDIKTKKGKKILTDTSCFHHKSKEAAEKRIKQGLCF